MSDAGQADYDELVKLNLEIAEWEQTRDDTAIAHLDECVSPELVFRRADRSVVGKAAFMAGLKEKGPFIRRESQDVSVTLVGERALVTLLVIGAKADGSVDRYRNVRVFFRRERGWSLEVWLNDPVVTAPEL